MPDAGRRHLTWAAGRLFDRPVSPVSRRELRLGGKPHLSQVGQRDGDLTSAHYL
jgi:hypothetical protein